MIEPLKFDCPGLAPDLKSKFHEQCIITCLIPVVVFCFTCTINRHGHVGSSQLTYQRAIPAQAETESTRSDTVSNPVPQTPQSDALPTALGSPVV